MTAPTNQHETDLRLLRRCFALASEARAAGQHPFGSLVADESGQILAEGQNEARPPLGNPTRHAELNAVSRAASGISPERLAKATLYTSTEPCCMCAGAVYWAGIGRVVYGLSEVTLLALTGGNKENLTLSLSCREVFARGQRRIEVIGPILEDEALKAHKDFWR
jgi:tRNA(Arg) A34 adenosine deaminase TadA